MKLWEFVVRRLIASIPVIFGVIVLIFIITHLVPVDPARLYAGIKAPPSAVEAIKVRLHLNDPLPVQFYYYFMNLLSGKLGYSLSIRASVNTGIGLFLPVELGLLFFTMLWSAPVGIYLGIVSATKRNKAPDVMSRSFAYTGLSVPSYFLAILLQLLFAVYLGILPISGLLAPDLTAPTHITGFYFIDALLTGNMPDLVSSFLHLILPVFALGLGITSLILRMTRSTMLEILSSPFVRALRAKGVPEKLIVRRYAFRAAMGPILTVLGLTTGYLLGGMVFIEDIFGIAGFSRWAYNAILGFDYNVVTVYALLISITYIISSILVDIAYAWVEPKIRFSEEGNIN